MNKIESKKLLQKISVTKSWFFNMIDKIDKTLTRIIKKKRDRTQINTIRNERGEITTDIKELLNIMNNFMSTNWMFWKKWIDS